MSSIAPTNVRVLVRIRPHSNIELNDQGSSGRLNLSNSESKLLADTITVNTPVRSKNASPMRKWSPGCSSYDSDNDIGTSVKKSTASSCKQFSFDAVHGTEATQDEVYNSVKDIVDSVVAGYNGTIVAYGQTGSGKTYTIFGRENENNNNASFGLIQRALRDLFLKMSLSLAKTEHEKDIHSSSSSTSNTTFRCSFFEIFNERVYDLLATDNRLDTNLSIREDNGSVYVEGLNEIQVADTTETETVLAKGLANRQVASTNMNRSSSRSHAVFVVSVKTENVNSDGLRKVRNSKFTLVDLAGSERQKYTASCGNRLKEACMINKSLLSLGNVINALVDKEAGKARHVPFRDSKLTFLLRDTWGGNSKTCLVATVSPSESAISETISTLKFAQRAKLIKNNAVLNEDTCGTVALLQAEVAKLRSKLLENRHTTAPSNHKIEEFELHKIESMKCRAERAESKVVELEKMLLEEREISNSIKRKVQEETTIRECKERRIDYIQTKKSKSNKDDEIRILREIVVSLQQELKLLAAKVLKANA